MQWVSKFPGLTQGNHRKTSDATTTYNCIAWAAGDDTRWWSHDGFYYWPPSVSRGPSPAHLVNVFRTLGYDETLSSDLEAGLDKVALYEKDGKWSHAVRQLPNGRWTSKMGGAEDIEVDRPESLEGLEYGKVFALMQRPAC